MSATAVASRRGPQALLALIAYTAAAFALFHLSWADPTARVIGRCCDSATYVDTFRMSGQALLSGHNPLYGRLMHAPQGFNVMWQPNVMPLVGIVVTPLEALFGPIVTYDLVLTMGLALSAWTCFLLLRHLVGGAWAPFVGGAVFGYSPVMTSHSEGHPQISFAVLVPVLLGLLLEILTRSRMRPIVSGALLGLAAAAQLLIGIELLVGTAIAAVVILAALAIRFRHQIAERAAHVAKRLGWALATFAVLAAAPLSEMLLGPQRIAGPIRDTRPNGTNLTTLLVPRPNLMAISAGAATAGRHHLVAMPGNSETVAYLGIPLLAALAAFVWWRRRDATVQVAAAATVVIAILSFGYSLHVGTADVPMWMPWRLFRLLPPLRSLAPSRLWLFVDLGVAVLVASALRQIGSIGIRRRRVVGSIGAAAILLTLLPTFRYPYWAPDIPSFFTTAGVDTVPPGSTVLVVPIARGGLADAASQVWQAESGLRFATVGGSVFVPNAHGAMALPGGDETDLTRPLDLMALGTPPDRLPPLTPEIEDVDRTELRALGVQAVVVGPMPDRAQAVALVDALVGTQPRIVGGVDLWTGVPQSLARVPGA
ncbi:MAG TPA: hypothetical protein VGS21_12190 [Acidimicrobiales bacterium]|nr:hypothetical protein [Acidimicrobiales bacterium]